MSDSDGDNDDFEDSYVPRGHGRFERRNDPPAATPDATPAPPPVKVRKLRINGDELASARERVHEWLKADVADRIAPLRKPKQQPRKSARRTQPAVFGRAWRDGDFSTATLIRRRPARRQSAES